MLDTRHPLRTRPGTESDRAAARHWSASALHKSSSPVRRVPTPRTSLAQPVNNVNSAHLPCCTRSTQTAGCSSTAWVPASTRGSSGIGRRRVAAACSGCLIGQDDGDGGGEWIRATPRPAPHRLLTLLLLGMNPTWVTYGTQVRGYQARRARGYRGRWKRVSPSCSARRSQTHWSRRPRSSQMQSCWPASLNRRSPAAFLVRCNGGRSKSRAPSSWHQRGRGRVDVGELFSVVYASGSRPIEQGGTCPRSPGTRRCFTVAFGPDIVLLLRYAGVDVSRQAQSATSRWRSLTASG